MITKSEIVNPKSEIRKSCSSAWLEHYTDNVGVGSSSLPETTKSRGELAQLARAPALHAGGQRFESVILHEDPYGSQFFDMLGRVKQRESNFLVY